MIVQPLQQADRIAWLDWLSDLESVYQHVGWHPILYWLGRPVSLCLRDSHGELAATLMVCPDHLGVTWLQLFAAGNRQDAKTAWETLWPAALESLEKLSVDSVWVMTMQSWLIRFLQESGFRSTGYVVALAQSPSRHEIPADVNQGVERIREEDLPVVEEIDHAAFSPPWQLDSDALRTTYGRSVLATAYRSSGQVLGYQITVPTAKGVHLARLAVLPAHQRKGIGRRLTVHCLNYFQANGAPQVTVNTQGENSSSLRLYRTLGFKVTGERYPVFHLKVLHKR